MDSDEIRFRLTKWTLLMNIDWNTLEVTMNDNG